MRREFVLEDCAEEGGGCGAADGEELLVPEGAEGGAVGGGERDVVGEGEADFRQRGGGGAGEAAEKRADGGWGVSWGGVGGGGIYRFGWRVGCGALVGGTGVEGCHGGFCGGCELGVGSGSGRSLVAVSDF